MNLIEEELADIQPDYIVLDEFHRCGAQEWGKGVKALLIFIQEYRYLDFLPRISAIFIIYFYMINRF